MEYRFLNKNSMQQLHRAFLEAFSDYYQDVSTLQEETLRNRAIKNGIDFTASVGVFDDDKMVGFTMVGIDNFRGERTAFDIATGIIKPYRGKGIARKMFQFLQPRLKEKNVTSFMLEVITENEMAIKAYEKTGFRRIREFQCFSLELKDLKENRSKVSFKIEKTEAIDFDRIKDFQDWQPSWENSLNTVKRIPDEKLILTASGNNEIIGYLIYYPGMQWILNLAVDPQHRREGVGSALLAEMKHYIPNEQSQVSIINIDSKDDGMISFLENAGFKATLGQYEMDFLI